MSQSSQKPVLLCDLDGCVVDLLPMWLAEYALLTGEFHQTTEITAYHHEQFVTNSAAWWNALEPALAKAKPVLDAIQAVNMLEEHFDIYFVTYCHPAAPRATTIKQEWLYRYFGNRYIDKMVFTKAKHLIRGDFFVEDCAENLDKWVAANPDGWGFLFQAPYNIAGDDWETITKWLIQEVSIP